MEYDEGRVDIRLLAEALLAVSSNFSEISPERFNLLAALYLSEGLLLPTKHYHAFETSRAELLKLPSADAFDDTKIQDALEDVIIKTNRSGTIGLNREVRLKTINHLIDQYVLEVYQIPPSHPLAVSALVGSIHSTLQSTIVEVTPFTAELSIGKSRESDDNSFPMMSPSSQKLRNLLIFKLSINQITPYFIDDITPEIITDNTPTYLIDSGPEASQSTMSRLHRMLHIARKSKRPARFMAVIPASTANYPALIKDITPALKTGLNFDAAILFSSSEIKNNTSDQLLLIFSQYIYTPTKPHLYVDVSNSNRSLDRLDIQERAILAGHIFNIHELRSIERQLRSVPSKVTTILNAQFSAGFQNIRTLCIEHNPAPNKPPKIYSPKNFIKNHHLEANSFNIAANPESILRLLTNPGDPACIYVIGDNGAGKTQLLCELIEKIESNRRTIGISTGVHDRFPFSSAKLTSRFEYRGARTSIDSISPSRLTKNNTLLASKIFASQNMLDALKECQECLGFAPRFYFMLKPEIDLGNTPTNIRLIKMSDDADENKVPVKINNYEFGIVRPATEREDERIVSFRSLSSGEQNISQLLLSIITIAERGMVFLVDEPEISLHLKWQQTLPRVFHLLSQRFGCSFVIATHSPTLITNANDRDSHSFMLNLGRMTELNDKERYSVETIILDGFGVYTPHNRQVHEACARIVAKTIETKGKHRPDQKSPLDELEQMFDKIKVEDGAYIPPGHQEDIDLIKKAKTAIKLLMDDQRAADELVNKAEV